MCFKTESKKQTTQTSVTVPPPTAEELRARTISNAIQETNLRSAGLKAVQTPSATFDAGEYLAANPDVAADPYFSRHPEEHYQRHGKAEGRAPGGLETQLVPLTDAEMTPEELQQKQINQKINDYIMGQIDQATKAQAEGGGGPSEETKKLVSDVYGAQRKLGEQEISRFTGEQAASRGMNFSDTPILREVGIQTGNLETGLRGAESAALLDAANKEKLFNAAMMEFQTNLQNSAFQKHLALGSDWRQNIGLMAGQRYALPTTTQTLSGFGSMGGASSGMGIFSGLLQGAGQFGSMFGGGGGSISNAVGGSPSFSSGGSFASAPFMPGYG